MVGIQVAYVLASVLFILGLKGLSHPRTAVRGNLIGAIGMLIAVGATLLDRNIISFEYILIGTLVGSVIGALFALKVKMTAMPQMVALFNGFGGAASVLVAGAVLSESLVRGGDVGMQFLIATAASGLIGAVTFWGSLVAFGKLQGLITEKPVRYRGEQVVKVLVFLIALYGAFKTIQGRGNVEWYWVASGVGSVLGILLTIPIGGADMPIVIALLNAYSGMAAAATGFVLNNSILIISGALVGASGVFLTKIMCDAMNRSLPNVLFGGVGSVVETIKADDLYGGKVKATTPEEVAMILKMARRVVFVPGYGMAVARAQTPVRILTEAMEKDGIEVEFGIHPVAGRMPGHMNVLLAEENIPYDKLKEMDAINDTFAQTDVVIVIGANDVVNPLARESSGTPISGMPILNVDKARTVVVIKRSLAPGFAGIPNPLFAAENTLMLFDDAKKAMEDLVKAYREAA
ncbi:MAG: NAD(P)(+) transhydrogenase (Re/Si-specific) subunit beta [Spirochaetes bacterium]|nr:NAD(P)(+) transhydrogenase (Re/Si-specific) subunit beta [Spirochaetota bacterium]